MSGVNGRRDLYGERGRRTPDFTVIPGSDVAVCARLVAPVGGRERRERPVFMPRPTDLLGQLPPETSPSRLSGLFFRSGADVQAPLPFMRYLYRLTCRHAPAVPEVLARTALFVTSLHLSFLAPEDLSPHSIAFFHELKRSIIECGPLPVRKRRAIVASVVPAERGALEAAEGVARTGSRRKEGAGA